MYSWRWAGDNRRGCWGKLECLAVSAERRFGGPRSTRGRTARRSVLIVSVVWGACIVELLDSSSSRAIGRCFATMAAVKAKGGRSVDNDPHQSAARVRSRRRSAYTMSTLACHAVRDGQPKPPTPPTSQH
jgi:hypothetical protein